MSKETKEDRIVRCIFEQVTEHLHELKALDANPNTKELDVERWAQSFLRNCLGYTASSGYSIRAQEAKGKMRPDLLVLQNDKPIFVVEIKKLNFDLNKSDFRSGKVQLSEYLNTIGSLKWGILTNGSDWRLYDFSQPKYGGVEVGSFQLKGEDDQIELGKKAVEEVCYDYLLDFHESSLSSNYWADLSKEAMAFSPESLAKAMLSADVVRYIAKSIRGEHSYKANIEVLTDKVYWLLEYGLNDSITGWNETKALEFQKYIKSQKRATRKSSKKKTEVNQNNSVPSAEPVASIIAGDENVDQNRNAA